jgi:hypothetical protein
MIKDNLPAKAESGKTNLESVVENLVDRIKYGNNAITNRELIDLCRNYTRTLMGIDPHIYHEIAETALNLLIKKHYAESVEAGTEPHKFVAEILRPLAARLPTQTWRSCRQTIRQQFSTPPPIAFLLSHLVNNGEGEVLLEPSAGTGNLLVWSKNQTFANEIDPRRREMLRILGISATAFNAEFINDFLPPEISIDCVLMNPPFSSSGGRTKNNSSEFGFRHARSALERLKNGGKFGIILGEAGGLDTRTGNDFWRKLSDRIEVSAVIKIDGREYARNGTTVDINLIIGRKFLEPQRTDWNRALNKTTCFFAGTVEEAFAKVQKFNLSLNR